MMRIQGVSICLSIAWTLATATGASAYTTYDADDSVGGSVDLVFFACKNSTSDLVICEDGAETVVDNTSCTMSSNLTINLGLMNDRITVVRGSTIACGVRYDEPTFNGNTVTVNGGSGDDILYASGKTVLNGDDGDDRVTIYHADGVANGGAGDDKVRSELTSGNEDLRGDGDEDCLAQLRENAAPNSFDCGGVESDYFNEPFGNGDVDCDTQISALTCD